MELRCPACGGALTDVGDALRCCADYPVRDGVPVLIDEATSVFSHADVLAGRSASFVPTRGRLRRVLATLTAPPSRNVVAHESYGRMSELLRAIATRPLVLVIGGGLGGEGIAALDAELVVTDVCFGPGVRVVCDAHRLPFPDGSFHGVVAQAVLEHVADPAQCVAEIHRVLVPDGLVYAETPFMQQVHGGAHDFTRFSHLGHRRLFRRFEEIGSGACCGPGMALAWAFQYWLAAMATGPTTKRLLRAQGTAMTWALPWLDPWLANRPGGLDAASGVWFLGRRSERTVSDREIVRGYRGAG
ncbi:MAG: methyltransferase domain-containing protein [Myxococcota bacterium]